VCVRLSIRFAEKSKKEILSKNKTTTTKKKREKSQKTKKTHGVAFSPNHHSPI